MPRYFIIKESVNEESISRIYSLISKGMLESWGILSPFKSSDYWIDKLIKDGSNTTKLNHLVDKEYPINKKSQIIHEFNIERLRDLKTILDKKGLGYNTINGVGQEEVFVRDEEGRVLFGEDRKEITEIRPSEETAFFINGISYKDIEGLADKLDQTGFIYYGPETKGKIVFYLKYSDQSGYVKDTEYNEVHVNRHEIEGEIIDTFYSKIRGQKLIFYKNNKK